MQARRLYCIIIVFSLLIHSIGGRGVYSEDGSFWYLNLTSTNATTGDFEPQWNLINSSGAASPVYPANVGDPATADLHPGFRTFSKSHLDKVTVPGDTLLWLWGGYGVDETYGNQLFNDVWYYSTSNGTWRHVAGGKGAYYRSGVITPPNEPAPRFFAARFFPDASGSVIHTYGGIGSNNRTQNSKVTLKKID
jgi:hypothetical protein